MILIDDHVAKIFKGSQRAKQLLPELEAGAAAAVCLARFAQEPLAEYCNMWTCADASDMFGYEALFMNIHPLQVSPPHYQRSLPLSPTLSLLPSLCLFYPFLTLSLRTSFLLSYTLPSFYSLVALSLAMCPQNSLHGMKSSLLRAMEQKLIDAVCEVGVDLNKAVANDHCGALLAFVGGLGLRKADALRKNISRSIRQVDSRNTLLVKKLLGVIVWTNAAGFLRICGTGIAEEEMEFPLDNTRIHPECYITHDFAPKICEKMRSVD